MVIIRDAQGNIIGKEASQGYVATRRLRRANEQRLCDAAMGIDREALARENKEARINRMNTRRVERGLEPIFDSSGVRSCGCEDYPCCGH